MSARHRRRTYVEEDADDDDDFDETSFEADAMPRPAPHRHRSQPKKRNDCFDCMGGACACMTRGCASCCIFSVKAALVMGALMLGLTLVRTLW